MIFAPLIISLRSKFRKRRKYLRAVAEVKGLSTRDLIDLRADATDMLRCLKNEFDGEPQRSVSPSEDAPVAVDYAH